MTTLDRNAQIRHAVPVLVRAWTYSHAPPRVRAVARAEAVRLVADLHHLSAERVRQILEPHRLVDSTGEVR